MKYIKLFEDINWIEDWEEEDPDIYKDYPEDFKKFLIENDALEKYHNNMLKYGFDLVYRQGNLKSFFNSGLNLISDSFDWGKTSEGYRYWEVLSNKWRYK